MPDINTIIEAVESERQYQRDRWGDLDDRNNVGNFLTYIKREADKGLAPSVWRGPGLGDEDAMAQVRKVAALCFAAMERFGTGLPRDAAEAALQDQRGEEGGETDG